MWSTRETSQGNWTWKMLIYQSPWTSNASQVYLALPVSVTSVWPGLCSAKNLGKATPSSGSRKVIERYIYLNDIFVLASSRDQLTDNRGQEIGLHTQSEEVCLVTSSSHWVPGVHGQFTNNDIHLPHHKMEKIETECRHMLHKHEVTAQQLTHLIGLLSSSTFMIAQAPLHYRPFKDSKTKSYNRARRTTIIQQEWTRNHWRSSIGGFTKQERSMNAW